MSPLDKVVDRIAEKAEQNKSLSYLEAYYCINIRCSPPLSKDWESLGLDWQICPSKFEGLCGVALRPPQKKIYELNQNIYRDGHKPPRLRPEEIQEIISKYPLHLSQEINQLYQRANGMFPIGLGEKDWNLFDNYFIFDLPERLESWPPLPAESLLDLYEAMEMYELFFASSSYSHIFPIMSFENGAFLACEGSDEPLESSSIYLAFSDEEPKVLYESLVDLLIVSLESYKWFT
ncbi:MAG: hypothetical protein F6K16_11790 [Symploca sp. SIO2B6]|nr:hypothetical protein [Symploca sp. SIO2B6]